jgi:hypothetical protein
VFVQWRFSTKDVKYKNIRKYTRANIRYYCEYISSIIHINMVRLKFLDEASFESRSLKRKRGVGRLGQQLNGIIQPAGLFVLRSLL